MLGGRFVASDGADFWANRAMRPAAARFVGELSGTDPWTLMAPMGERIARHGAFIAACSPIAGEPFHTQLCTSTCALLAARGLTVDAYFPSLDFDLGQQLDALAKAATRKPDFVVMDVPGVHDDDDRTGLSHQAAEMNVPVIVLDQSAGPKRPANLISVCGDDVLGGRLQAEAAKELAQILPEETTAVALDGGNKKKRGRVFAAVVEAEQGWDVDLRHNAGGRPGHAGQVVEDLLLEKYNAGKPVDVLALNAGWLVLEALEPVRLLESRGIPAPYVLGYDKLHETKHRRGAEMIVRSVLQDPVRIGRAAADVMWKRLCGARTPLDVRVGAELSPPGTGTAATETTIGTGRLSDADRELFIVTVTNLGERYERNPNDPAIAKLMNLVSELDAKHRAAAKQVQTD